MSLKQRLIEQIVLEGPMSVADYMARCLHDPIDGYYTYKARLGADGDFITAPLISQMFGEMIGIWVAQTWQAMGAPQAFRLIEVGGGDGTLMSDVLRVCARVTGLTQAVQILMVEPSPTLRALQAKAIAKATFVGDLAIVPADLPVILIANEVLDCLPARQYVRTDTGWAERCVGLVDGELSFGLIPAEVLLALDVEPGQVVEVSAAQQHFANAVTALIRLSTGAALLIDYGRDTDGTGDTLQALYRHEKQHPLSAPGDHDLTVWADFVAVRRTVSTHVKCSPCVTQATFLKRLGLETRRDALIALHPDRAETLTRQYARLTDADAMGELFKVVGLAWPSDLPLFALEDEAIAG